MFLNKLNNYSSGNSVSTVYLKHTWKQDCILSCNKEIRIETLAEIHL